MKPSEESIKNATFDLVEHITEDAKLRRYLYMSVRGVVEAIVNSYYEEFGEVDK